MSGGLLHACMAHRRQLLRGEAVTRTASSRKYLGRIDQRVEAVTTASTHRALAQHVWCALDALRLQIIATSVLKKSRLGRLHHLRGLRRFPMLYRRLKETRRSPHPCHARSCMHGCLPLQHHRAVTLPHSGVVLWHRKNDFNRAVTCVCVCVCVSCLSLHLRGPSYGTPHQRSLFHR